MTGDITFQPPIGIAPVIGFQPSIAVAPSLGFQPPIGRAPDVGVTRNGNFQAAIGISTSPFDYNSPSLRRETFTLLENAPSNLELLRLKMAEQFHAPTLTNERYVIR